MIAERNLDVIQNVAGTAAATLGKMGVPFVARLPRRDVIRSGTLG